MRNKNDWKIYKTRVEEKNTKFNRQPTDFMSPTAM
jgi:hypothetical protein